MSFAQVLSRAAVGVNAPLVRVEVHLAGGLPAYTLVGLPATAVRESRQRVRAAIENSGFTVPRKHIVVSLAPADLPKEGGRFDLPIALALLAAAGQFQGLQSASLADLELFGELGLDGELRPVRGLLPAARAAAAAGRAVVAPGGGADEAARVPGVEVYSAQTLREVVDHVMGYQHLPRANCPEERASTEAPDLSDVVGQFEARRALEVAAAGGHHLLLAGPPGVGKTMLARRLPGLLPPLEEHEAAEVAALASVSALGYSDERWGERPFRAPHHTASAVALVGGGRHAQPGEISLAHKGALFLDELPEFERRVLEVLREPLESGFVDISRANFKVRLPASFQLVAAMNPCPCGYLGDGTDRCQCTSQQVLRYRARVSGPLLDRIDLHINVPHQTFADMRPMPPGETSAAVRVRVEAARVRQKERSGTLNAALGAHEAERHCALNSDAQQLFESAADRYRLSARACGRVLKVARTIADLADAPQIDTDHLLESLSFRESQPL